jgi:hypothetical protein
LGLSSLSSPYHELAADVNASGTVSTLDLTLARQLILGMRDDFADVAEDDGGLWRCAIAGLEDAAYQGSYDYSPLSSDQTGQDFHCFRRGDVNGSWTNGGGGSTPAALAAAKSSASSAQSASIQLMARSKEAAARTTPVPADGEASEVVVPIHAKDFEGVGGLQFTLSWDADALEYVAFEDAALDGLSAGNINAERTSEGLLAVVWDHPKGRSQNLSDDTALMKLRFRVKGAPGQTVPIDFSSEMAQLAGHRVQGKSLMPTAAAVTASGGTVTLTRLPEKFALLGSYPNPTSGQARLAIDLPKSAEVVVSIYDLLGRRVLTMDRKIAAGAERTLPIDASRLASGLYLYRVRATMTDKTEVDTGKITVVK